MSDTIDLTPATQRMTSLVRAVNGADLDRDTPSDIPVHRLLAHIDGLALAFRVAAEDPHDPMLASPPGPGQQLLEPGWAQRIPDRLAALATTWNDTPQDESMTMAGSIPMPRSVTVRVALQELVLHGWDLARALDQPYQPDPHDLAVVHHMVTTTAESGVARDGLFGPVVPVDTDAVLLDRTVALAGRRPGWPG